MPNGISNSALVDLQRTTLQNLPNLDFEYALKYQEWQVINNWFAKEKIQIESGTSIERNIVLDNSGNAQHVRLYQKTAINQNDVQQKVTAPWVQAQSYYSIERREALRNRKPAMYIKLLESRRVDGMVSLAELLEERGWRAPINENDDLNPRGLPYWLVKAPAATVPSATSGGFTGQTVRFGDGTTSTTIGGLSTSNDKWRNYADVYSAVDGDFVKRMRKAFHATAFKSPVIAKDLKEGPLSKYKIYMGLDELTEYEDLVTKQNDNLGSDADKFHGVTTFKRVPIEWAPILDADSENPVYGVNHAKFYPIVQSGDWLRESEPMSDVELHNVITTFIDSSYQYFCGNRRTAGFVLSNTPAT